MEIKIPLGNWINRVFDIVRSEINTQMSDYNIEYAEFTVLYYMAYYGDGQSSAELTKLLILDKAAISRAVKNLENEGYITRKQDDTDKRQQFIYLTEQGREIQKVVSEVYDNMFSMITVNIDHDKVNECLDTLNSIYKNVAEIKNNPK